MDQHPGDGGAVGAACVAGPGRLAEQAVAMRATARRIAADQAEQLRQVARLAAGCAAEARAVLAAAPRVPGQPSDAEVVASAVTGEVMVVLGISARAAEALVGLADRLTRVLPATLAALATGRLDLARARVLAEATAVLEDGAARAVQALVLPAAGRAAWDGPSPRVWQARVARAVVRVDPAAAGRRRAAAVAARCVRAWPVGDGTGVLALTAADHDIVLADRVVSDLARARPAVGPDGTRLGMDQRRADALVDLFHRVHHGDHLPTASGGPHTPHGEHDTSGADGTRGPDGPQGGDGSNDSRGPDGEPGTRGSACPPVAPPVTRRPDVGIVLHADTLFGDGPAAADPGELRGLGPPAPIDPVSAAGLARAELDRGAGTRVLLVRGAGALFRVVPIGPAPAGGWTRSALADAVRAALPGLAPLRTDRYAPTAAIAGHVRAAQPRCGSYDCPRAADRCDLDHDVPWPRGPTDAACMCPRCRRHHEHKTRGLVHTRLHPDGSLTTRMLTGLTVTTRPEPLPGYGLGEGYERLPA